MNFYTYLYRDPSRNNEPIYVGKGSGVRAWTHLKTRRQSPFTQKLAEMKRDGIEPTITMLCKDVDEELAFLCEVEAIDKFGRLDLGTGTLYNQNAGGAGFGGGHNAATRQKIGEASKKMWRDDNHKTKTGAAITKAKNRPCSYLGVDYPSQKAARLATGHTHCRIIKHPSFNWKDIE